MWGGIAQATNIAGTAGSAAAAVGTGKLLAGATIFGSAITVGLALAIVQIAPASAPGGVNVTRPARTFAASHPADWSAAKSIQAIEQLELEAAPEAHDAARALADLGAAVTPSDLNAPPLRTPNTATTAGPSGSGAALAKFVAAPDDTREDDTLMKESLLVAQARGQLLRGDLHGALAAIEATRALPTRQLEPEELSIRARALSGLGRADEAATVEARLKAQYPGHALAR
jgi:hypothetical protein